ncbi:hypothetical protein LRS13_10415 [Svornostia abyssi]|uniref:P/Homo B domain-containing protein n=1 Tax=Svornostia abyssi TaxID=2898438 RepID=A0ABY5PNK0_9ACTN|nr:hypothetical protein LRS13_10415 [Parviterribacteraceae bacterium J379]
MISRTPAPPSCLAALVLAGTLALSTAPAAQAQEPTATTFPANAQATGAITGGFDGQVWTPTATGLIAFNRTGTQSASFPTIAGAPWNDVTGGPDGRLWAGGQAQLLAPNLLPFTGVPSIAVSDIGTEQITDVAPGPDDNVWFTVPSANRFGFATPAGTATAFSLVGTTAEAGTLVSIATGGDGLLWFTKRFPGSIVRRNADGSLTSFTAGLDPGAQPFAIALGPDGNVWFTDGAAARAGRITPAGVITMFDAVASTDLIAGPDGNLWLAGGSTLSTGGVFTPRSLPADTLAVGADGNMWGVKLTNGAVSRLALGGQQFSNPTRIDVPATGNSGKAGLYPSPIAVSGLQGTVTKVTARLNGVHHRFANDLQVMLVGPGGQSTVLMASATTRSGDLNTVRHSLTGESIAFTAGGREPARRITSGVFSPIDSGFALNFEAPAPTTPSGGLAQFAGTQPNGTWNLFVVDSEGTPLTTGAIAGGWSLDIETTGAPAPPNPPAPPTPPDTPAPPPPPPAPQVIGAAAPRDTTPPTLRVTGVPKRTSLKALRRGLRVRVTPSEPVRLTATVAIRRTPGGSSASRCSPAPAPCRARPRCVSSRGSRAGRDGRSPRGWSSWRRTPWATVPPPCAP